MFFPNFQPAYKQKFEQNQPSIRDSCSRTVLDLDAAHHINQSKLYVPLGRKCDDILHSEGQGLKLECVEPHRLCNPKEVPELPPVCETGAPDRVHEHPLAEGLLYRLLRFAALVVGLKQCRYRNQSSAPLHSIVCSTRTGMPAGLRWSPSTKNLTFTRSLDQCCPDHDGFRFESSAHCPLLRSC